MPTVIVRVHHLAMCRAIQAEWLTQPGHPSVGKRRKVTGLSGYVPVKQWHSDNTWIIRYRQLQVDKNVTVKRILS